MHCPDIRIAAVRPNAITEARDNKKATAKRVYNNDEMLILHIFDYFEIVPQTIPIVQPRYSFAQCVDEHKTMKRNIRKVCFNCYARIEKHIYGAEMVDDMLSNKRKNATEAKAAKNSELIPPPIQLQISTQIPQQQRGVIPTQSSLTINTNAPRSTSNDKSDNILLRNSCRSQFLDKDNWSVNSSEDEDDIRLLGPRVTLRMLGSALIGPLFYYTCTHLHC